MAKKHQDDINPDDNLLNEGEERVFPVIPLIGQVAFPHMLIPLNLDEHDTRMIDKVMDGDQLIALFTHRASRRSKLYTTGTLCLIHKVLRMPDGSVRLMLQGLQRIELLNLDDSGEDIFATVSAIPEKEPGGKRVKALRNNLIEVFGELLKLADRGEEALIAALNLEENGRLADFVATNISLDTADQQKVLAAVGVVKRLTLINRLVNKELEVLRLGRSIQQEVSEEMTRNQRDYYLRQQLEAIRRELGEGDDRSIELNELEERVAKMDWPEDVGEKARRQLRRLGQMHPGSAEYVVSHTYLSWLLDLPWGKTSKDNLDLKRAQKILDEDHYGLSKVKDRILEFLAVRSLAPEARGPILCLVGPPGTGKTSLGRSIARALGREFVRASLGGVHDEAEIRGHRRTYIGALPGRIMQGLKTAGTSNPVFMLDEVDKLASDFRGDPSSALLEVLDPEQNWSFRDNYIEEPYNLSHVFFITTANTAQTIPRPLLDRMEVIHLAGYTQEEKAQIAKRYLFPRQRKFNGLNEKQLAIPLPVLRRIADSYTREAGVRNLERTIGTVCRKVAWKYAAGEREMSQLTKVKLSELEEYLGSPPVNHQKRRQGEMVGVATGLVWTPVGGEIIFIEAASMPGKGRLSLTGQLGDVMQESAKIALSYVRANGKSFGIKNDFTKERDLHIHVPAGAVPKDGPSAGVTLATALISLLTGRPVKRKVAMTGELTLRGEVLPVGGLKEKLLAARRAKIETVIIPEKNRPDIEDSFKDDESKTLDNLELVYVEKLSQVIEAALE